MRLIYPIYECDGVPSAANKPATRQTSYNDNLHPSLTNTAFPTTQCKPKSIRGVAVPPSPVQDAIGMAILQRQRQIAQHLRGVLFRVMATRDDAIEQLAPCRNNHGQDKSVEL